MKTIAISSTSRDGKNLLNIAYVMAFANAGLTPFITPNFIGERSDILSEETKTAFSDRAIAIEKIADGLVLSGGEDVNPLMMGMPNYASSYCNSSRDLFEMYLLQRFVEVGKPVMGICRGMQLVGQFLGLPNFKQEISGCGELHNAVDRELATRQEATHSVYLYGELAKYTEALGIKDNIMNVNSFHHQGFTIADNGKRVNEKKRLDYISRIEKDCEFNVLASTDAIIEAVAHKTLPIFCVQWHPEEYYNDSIIIKYFLQKYLNI